MVQKLHLLRVVLCVFLLVYCLDGYSLCHASSSYPVFDALIYRNKPDLSLYGLQKIRMVYQGELWNVGESHTAPNLSKIIQISKNLDPRIVTCFDIENWAVVGKPKQIDESIAKYISVVDVAKQVNPQVSVGFYSVLPIRDYSRAIESKGTKQYDVWLRENRRLLPLSTKVDVIFPSLYTFYDDPKGWEKYAIANLKEAKKYGKPVYAFIWPMFHDNTPLKGKYISVPFWRLQLETCKKYADGIVIWGGWNDKVLDWDPAAGWWLETIKFIHP